MKELTAYVSQKNHLRAMFKKASLLDLSNAADRQAIARSLDADLSPENLTCDGELSSRQVATKYRLLSNAAKQLIKLDSSVRIYEFSA